MITKLFLCICKKPFSWVCNINLEYPFPVFLYIIYDYEMVLIPVYNTRERNFFCKHIKAQASTFRFKTDCFSSLADAKQRYSILAQSANLS